MNKCYYQLVNSPSPTTALAQLYVLNAFYGTSCALNAAGENCYDKLTTLQTSPPPQVPGWVNPFYNYRCNSSTTVPLYVYCNFAFSTYGCCYSNMVIIAEQTVKNPSVITLLPPCVQRYLYLTCPKVSLSTSFCTNGTDSNVTFIQGFLYFTKIPSILAKFGPYLPNAYNQTSITNLQGIISSSLMQNPLVNTIQVMLPAINIQITNFSYYNETAGMLTTTTGIASPNEEDYIYATSAKFWFNVVQVYSNSDLANINNQYMNTDSFTKYIAGAYGLADTDVITKSENPIPFVYTAEPFNTAHSSSSILFGGINILLINSIIFIITVLTILF